MVDANRTVVLSLPYGVSVTHFPEVKRLFDGKLTGEDPKVQVFYHGERSSSFQFPRDYVGGCCTVGGFSIEDLEVMATTLFDYFEQKIHVLLREHEGSLMWEMGLQLEEVAA